jgi:hypothetical protein
MLFSVYAQVNKLIFLNSGEKIEYSKLKIKKMNIEYKTLDGISQSLNYDDIFLVVRKKDVMISSKIRNMNYLKAGPLVMNIDEINPDNSCTKGMLDAINYTKFSGAQIGGGLTGIIWPIGMIGTAAIASAKPQEESLNFPQNALRDDQLYMDCYLKTAKKQKSRATWLTASTGFTVTMAVAMLVVTLSM